VTPAEPPRAPAQRVEIVCSAATVAKGIALAFAVVLVVVAKDALLAIALAGVLVLGLDPLVIALEARGWGRGRAAVFVFALIGAVVLVIVVWAAKPLWNEVRQFAGDLPGYVDKIQHSAVFSDIDKQTDVFKKVHSAVTNLAKDIPDAAASLLGAAGQLVGAVFSLVTLAFLTLFGLVARPQITHSVSELMRPGSGERFERILEEVSRTISFALIGNVVISVIAGSVVGVTAAIVGAPTPAVLAVIVGLFDLIPQVGSAIAAVIVVGVTLVASGTGPAVILLVVILVYQQVENYLIQPAVMRQAVELSAFATIAVVMLGSALLGVVGAILAVPVAASVKVVLRELTMARRERMAALRQAQPQSP
jgi:predicted PurR-regulated permease PerM